MITPLYEALAAVRARAHPVAAEDVSLTDAHGRVLAEGVRARRDQPATDISMMDGYALRSVDAGAPLRVAGEIAAGDAPWTRELQACEAARIFTGAPLPPGADCVVMQEHAVRSGGEVGVQQPPKAGQHIRRRGEELTAGTEALLAGRVLDSADLALAAACGAASVRAHRRPRVAVLSTGSELVPLGFELFVRLAIRLLLGDRNPERPRVRARLRGSLSQVKGLTFFPRGRISAEGSQLVFAPGAQQSSMQIASWSGANAVAVIPPGEGRVDEGAEIEVLLTGNIA